MLFGKLFAAPPPPPPPAGWQAAADRQHRRLMMGSEAFDFLERIKRFGGHNPIWPRRMEFNPTWPRGNE